jgi:hypothetical protein
VRFGSAGRCSWGLVLSVGSDSSESEGGDLGGEGSSCWSATRSYGLRVRSIGPLLSSLPFPTGGTLGLVGDSSFAFFGNVRAQFSHGPGFSLYVFLKLESRRSWFAFCAVCSAATRGLSGGVSAADDVVEVPELEA